MNQKVVIVAGEDELRDRLFEALEETSAEAIEVPSVTRALELTREIAIQLLVVRYPLEDMKLVAMLKAFHANGAASRGAQVVVLAPGRSIGGLRRSAGSGVAILRSDSDLEELTRTFGTFLRRSPRFEENLLVGVDLELAQGKVRKMLQVVNLSEGGMLLRIRTPPEIGTSFHFELNIPELKRPITGVGEVVRVVDRLEGSRSGGIGVRILRFHGDGRERLTKFLKIRRLPPALAR